MTWRMGNSGPNAWVAWVGKWALPRNFDAPLCRESGDGEVDVDYNATVRGHRGVDGEDGAQLACFEAGYSPRLKCVAAFPHFSCTCSPGCPLQKQRAAQRAAEAQHE